MERRKWRARQLYDFIWFFPQSFFKIATNVSIHMIMCRHAFVLNITSYENIGYVVYAFFCDKKCEKINQQWPLCCWLENRTLCLRYVRNISQHRNRAYLKPRKRYQFKQHMNMLNSLHNLCIILKQLRLTLYQHVLNLKFATQIPIILHITNWCTYIFVVYIISRIALVSTDINNT